jgi:hypothetical protein
VASADAFIGRRQLIEELAAAPPQGAARLADAYGVAGMGKTWFVRRLREVAEEWPGEVLQLPLQFEEAAAPTTPSQAWDAFLNLLRVHGLRLFADGDPGAFANDLSAAEQARLIDDIRTSVYANDADIKAGANVGGVEIDATLEEALLSPKFDRATHAFVSRFSKLVKRKTALVTVEGFDWIAGGGYARRVISLLARLPNTLVVITRSPGAAAPGIAGTATERKELEPFSPAEVGELLACCLPGRTLDSRLADVVHEWSAGHVFTAALAAKYLRTLEDPDPAAFEAKLAKLPDDLVAQRIEIALQIIRAPGADDLAETVRALSVARSFDDSLFAALVEAAPANAVERLERADLVEPAGEGTYRVHSFVREPLEAGLSPARRRLLHRRAADHYFALVTADEPELDESARPYDHWYRYEKPEWQVQLREWLYHNRAAAATEDDREQAHLEFARVFLDAFWWWGCYVPFPFCRDLIADWRRVRDDDADWVQDLQQLLEAYPLGYRKHGEGRWDDVRAALVGVRGACGLDDVDEFEGNDARHTRGLIDNFLAHALRYREAAGEAERAKSYRQALALYEEAARLFGQGQETWELAWTLFETAELHADNGDLERARESWRRAVEVALEEDDWELKANLHRLVADIRWQEGATAAAFDAHALAVLHAYLFQCKTPSRRPDAYTVAFYSEQLERVFGRLKEVNAAALADVVARLAEPFGTQPPAVDSIAAVLAGDDAGRLGGLLFPAAPADDELMEVRSDFTRRVHLLAEDLGPETARDLEQVEP